MRLLLALALATAACAPSAAPPPTGGTVILAWQEPETLNPLYSTGAQTNAVVYAVAVEGLLRPGPDGAYQPVLARDVPTPENQGVTVGADGSMSVRYRLRSGVRWSDGAPLTSADVRFTWETIVRDPRVATREGYDLIETVETPDELTAIVRYRAIYPAYATRFDAILPRHALEGADLARSDYGRAPLGTGPYRVSEFVAGDHVTAERNPRYREAGKPLLDRIVFRFVPSLEAAKAQLKVGEVQANLNVGEADVAELEGAGLRIEGARSPIVEALAFNLARPVVGDRAIRRALVLATPKARIAETLLYGRAAVAHSEVPIGWAAVPDLRQDEYDPAGARALLDRAGWLPGQDGVRARGGVRATARITSTTGNKLREQVEQVLVDSWRAIGIEATIRNVPPSVLTGSWTSGGTRKRGDFDVVLAQLGLGTVGGIDPQGYLSQRHRCDAIPRQENAGAGANYERFCSARVDALLDEAGRTLELDRRKKAYAEVLRVLNDEAVAIWLYERARINAFAQNLAGTAGNPWDVATWNVADWYLRPPRY